MRVIQLTRGQHTVVDDDVYEWASKFNWHAHKARNTWYAVRTVRLPSGKRKMIRLHREILDAPDGVDVDHRDGDGLHNLKDNIRISTESQNSMNRRPNRNSSSRYKGVSFCAREGKWLAQIQIAGGTRHLGYFEAAEEAARAYDTAATENFKEFAWLNFPKEALRASPIQS